MHMSLCHFLLMAFRYAWRYRRRKAAIKIQATYRMHLVKFVVQKERAERRQRNMELNAREEVAVSSSHLGMLTSPFSWRERGRKRRRLLLAARRGCDVPLCHQMLRAGMQGTASRGKTVEMKQRKETATSDSAGSIESRAITNKGVTFETMEMEVNDELKHEDAEDKKTEMLPFVSFLVTLTLCTHFA